MIELRVLGSLELKQDGAQVLSVLSQPKRAALLVYLALSAPGGARRRDELTALFWPEHDEEHARAALRQSIYFLRRSLGDDLVQSAGDEGIAVRPERLWCDALALEALIAGERWEEALGLYRGDLLPAFLLDGAPALVEWVDAERARLRQRAADAAWRITELRRAAGEPAAAAEWGRRALGFTPLDESAVLRCMELLEAAGNRAGALQLFDDLTRRLERELELTPSAALQSCATRLRTAAERALADREPVLPAAAGAASAAIPAAVPSAAVPPPPPARSIAVLPFVSTSANPDDAYLSDGLTDEIITTLAKIPGLRVASRTSAFVYKARSEDIRAIARALNVANVLEGSVQRSGNRLRITTQLIECRDGYHLWSAHWDSEMRDVFQIEDEIAVNVARVLRVLLRDADDAGWPRRPRTNVKAYEHYLRGREYFLQTRLRSLRFAREMFEKAIAEDPDYALAHAALADTLALVRTYYPASESDMPAAERASLRALELDPTLAEAHSAHANVSFQLGRLAEAESSFRKALSLDPQLFEAHYFFARMCFQNGRLEEAADLFERACRLRNDFQAAFFGAQALAALGRPEDAARHYERALASAAEHLDLHPDDPRAATMRAVALCRLGRTEEGLEWGRRAIELDPLDAGVRYNVACLFAVAGDAAAALNLLEDALRVGFGNRGWLEQDPDLDSLRQNPRFQVLLAAM